MSEQKLSFMQELDLWTDANVIGPLFIAARDYDDQHTHDWENTVEKVMKAIRTKVLDSYHNGLQAKPRSSFGKPRRQST